MIYTLFSQHIKLQNGGNAMKTLAILLLILAYFIIMFKGQGTKARRQFYSLLSAYNELYVKCKDVLEQEGEIDSKLKKYLKRFKENFETISDLRKYMVKMGHYIQEETNY